MLLIVTDPSPGGHSAGWQPAGEEQAGWLPGAFQSTQPFFKRGVMTILQKNDLNRFDSAWFFKWGFRLNPWLKMIVHHEDWNFDNFCPSELWPIHTHPMFSSGLIYCVYPFTSKSKLGQPCLAGRAWLRTPPTKSSESPPWWMFEETWREMKKIRNVLWIYLIEPPKR